MKAKSVATMKRENGLVGIARGADIGLAGVFSGRAPYAVGCLLSVAAVLKARQLVDSPIPLQSLNLAGFNFVLVSFEIFLPGSVAKARRE